MKKFLIHLFSSSSIIRSFEQKQKQVRVKKTKKKKKNDEGKYLKTDHKILILEENIQAETDFRFKDSKC